MNFCSFLLITLRTPQWTISIHDFHFFFPFHSRPFKDFSSRQIDGIREQCQSTSLARSFFKAERRGSSSTERDLQRTYLRSCLAMQIGMTCELFLFVSATTFCLCSPTQTSNQESFIELVRKFIVTKVTSFADFKCASHLLNPNFNDALQVSLEKFPSLPFISSCHLHRKVFCGDEQQIIPTPPTREIRHPRMTDYIVLRYEKVLGKLSSLRRKW